MTLHPGFTASDWRQVPVFGGRCAEPSDVEHAVAVFALGDTLNGRPIDMGKPAPAIWYGEEDEFAALIVQAEAHETDDGETMQVIGLLLPSGQTAVALLHDLDLVDEADPVWRALLTADTSGLDDDDDDYNDDGAEWADPHASDWEDEEGGL
jgi:hypothetical protein